MLFTDVADVDREILLRTDLSTLIQAPLINRDAAKLCDKLFWIQAYNLRYPNLDTTHDEPFNKHNALIVIAEEPVALDRLYYFLRVGVLSVVRLIYQSGNFDTTVTQHLFLEAIKWQRMKIMAYLSEMLHSKHLKDFLYKILETTVKHQRSENIAVTFRLLVARDDITITYHTEYLLRLAANQALPDVVERLLLIDMITGKCKNQALCWAVRNNTTNPKDVLAVVKLLVNSGASISHNNDDPIRWAAARGDVELFKYILSAGGDVHALNEAPLRRAVQYGHYEIIKTIVEFSTNLNLSAVYDYAINYAKYNQHKRVVALLERTAEQRNTSFNVVKHPRSKLPKRRMFDKWILDERTITITNSGHTTVYHVRSRINGQPRSIYIPDNHRAAYRWLRWSESQ